MRLPTHLPQIYLLSYAIMLGASSVFMSSFGYQVGCGRGGLPFACC
jgi:hypothetical protein